MIGLGKSLGGELSAVLYVTAEVNLFPVSAVQYPTLTKPEPPEGSELYAAGLKFKMPYLTPVLLSPSAKRVLSFVSA